VPAPVAPKDLRPTEDNILGPFYRKGAPFRAKITPPLIEGTVMLIAGRVWGVDTRKPLAGCVLDVWQADHHGRYDNDDESKPPKPDVFANRARLITDENGGYEYESIHPGRYKIGPETWRPSHVHYLVRHPGYKPLVTQLYFKGDPHNETDQFIKPSLIIELRKERSATGQVYEAGVFDIVLARA
jgi:catechol 1,2-dioxygenase